MMANPHTCCACKRSTADGAAFHKDKAQKSGLKPRCTDCLREARRKRWEALDEEQRQAVRDAHAEAMRAFRRTPAGKIAEKRTRTLECYHRYRTSEKAKKGAKRRMKKYAEEGLATKWQARYRARKKMASNTGWADEEPEFTEAQQRQILEMIEEDKRQRGRL